jgi:hypothetical protein
MYSLYTVASFRFKTLSLWLDIQNSILMVSIKRGSALHRFAGPTGKLEVKLRSLIQFSAFY